MDIKPTVHMIGNAHIDPVWLWRVGEGRAEVLSTYRSALERMDETDGFIFSSGGATTYRWVQEDDPALFQAIQRRIAEGRWEIVNGWLIQPDCNIPCGESFVRHGLYGQRAFQDMFGCRAVTGYNVDSFGHAGSLPQILRGCGLTNYVFTRPQPYTDGIHPPEKDLPGPLFWWESDDGSRVLAGRPPTGYGSGPGDLIGLIDAAAEQTPPEVGHILCFYGVGNHGGGPTKANLASILQAMARPDGPQVCFDRTDRFFELVRASGDGLPVVRDELQHHARGCYAAVSEVKRRNRKSECALLTAEKFAALAHRFCGAAYPRQALTRAWEKVLFSQFHDILAGTSIREAYDEVLADYAASERAAEQALDAALAALSARIDTQGDGRALLVFNPHPWAQSAAQTVPIETAICATQHWFDDWRGKFLPGAVCLTDDRGQAVPCQVSAIEHDGAYYLLHLAFLADLPALGYRCYHLSIPQDAPTWTGFEAKRVSSIENECLRLTFDPATGWLASLFDKKNGVECLRAPGGVPVVVDDPSDTWSHYVVSFDNVIGQFEAKGDIALIESGPVRQVVRVRAMWGCSTVILDYILYSGDRQIYLNLVVDWREQLKMLKLAFPLALDNPQSTSSIPYGSIRRADDGGEEPCQGWVDVGGAIGGQPYGLALLNDSKYGYDVLKGELRLSILRSPAYAFHMPRQIEPGVTYRFTDQGEQTVRLALLPHAGDWTENGVVHRSESFNTPSIVRQADAHSGEWPATASLACCDAPNVILTVLKQAEEGEDWIVRGYEVAGQETTAHISLGMDGASWSVAWKPHQIKTLRLGQGAAPVEVNMLEE